MSAARAPTRRGAGIALAVAAGVLLVALVTGRPPAEGPPLDPRSDTASGTSALVELLRRLGAEVDLSVGMPGDRDDVALVLQDRLTDRQRDELLGWVGRGGRLVVAGPGPLAPRPVERGLLDAGLGVVSQQRCTIDALAGIGAVDTGGGLELEVPAGARSCYGDGDTAFVVAATEGRGVLVATGGPGFAVNALLADAGNAAFAAALLAPEPATRVRFVDPPVPAGGGEKSLVELIDPGVGRAIAQLAIAFVLYAAWRAIRLGRPVVEPQPVAVAGSELVGAVGRLLARTRSPGAAADLLRADARRAIAARVGLPADAPAEQVADVVAARTGAAREEVLGALGTAPVRTDDELVAVARAAASIRQEVLR